MKKVFIAAALAAMIVSCGSKGNKSAEMIAESESDSLFTNLYLRRRFTRR